MNNQKKIIQLEFFPGSLIQTKKDTFIWFNPDSDVLKLVLLLRGLLLLKPRVGVEHFLPAQPANDELADDRRQVVERHSNLQHRVALSQGGRVGLGERVEVHADAEWNGDLKQFIMAYDN